MWKYLLKILEQMFLSFKHLTFWKIEGLGSQAGEGQARKSGIPGCEPNLDLILFLL